VARIGVDIAKESFQVDGVDAHGKVIVPRQLSQSKVLPSFAQLSLCLRGIEACGGAHSRARKLQKLSYDVRLMAVPIIQPSYASQKTDQNEAEAICEAASRPRTRCVPMKSKMQQALTSRDTCGPGTEEENYGSLYAAIQ
jgi:transposase